MNIKTVTALIMLTALGFAQPGFAASDHLAEAGHQVFKFWCTPCHGSGKHMPGTQALAAKYQGAVPALLEQRTDLTPEVVRQFVRHGINVMPPFRKTEISDAELNALGVYLSRNRSR